MRPVQRMGLFLATVTLLSAGCNRDLLDVDVSGIDTEVEVERFDRALFNMDRDTLSRAVDVFYSDYGDFFDIFNVYVINIGQGSTRMYENHLLTFLNDPINREVYEYTNEIYASMEDINAQLTDGFRHYLYHYPDSIVPRVVGYVSRFNPGLFTVDHFVGVGLDQYLGRDCRYYRQMAVPLYLARNKEPWRIPMDVMLAWATQIYPYNDSVDNVLNRMIYEGMLTYFVDAMYPGKEDSLIIGFTGEQLKWCVNNEKQMWTYLVEEKLLFSNEPMNIRKLVEDAPYTQFYTIESPGRAAVWQGWQIVRKYAERNPQLTFPEIMASRDYQEILGKSRYNP